MNVQKVLKILNNIVHWYGMRENYPDKKTADELLPWDQQPPEIQCIMDMIKELSNDAV